MGELIRLEHLGHEYPVADHRPFRALDDINLSIADGEFVAVIGTNGSGKSTLAKHLNALLLPTSGRCIVAGMDTQEESHLWDIRQTVGMVFQNPDNQIVAAIVEEDVAFGPENLGVPSAEIRTRVDEALRAVGMTAYREHAPHLLSGGQKQRIAIAGVIAMRPRCLVMDEATAMLDPKGRAEVLTTVRSLNRNEGITLVYITHFMEEAVLADRVIVMDQGKVLAQGTPHEIFSQVEKLREIGLEAPVAAELADHLRRRGIPVPNVITDEELVVALCH